MAFISGNLKGNIFPSSNKQLTMHSYVSTTDTIATIKAPNYFIGRILRVGDLIQVKGTDGGALLMIVNVTADANEIVSASATAQGTFA